MLTPMSARFATNFVVLLIGAGLVTVCFAFSNATAGWVERRRRGHGDHPRARQLRARPSGRLPARRRRRHRARRRVGDRRRSRPRRPRPVAALQRRRRRWRRSAPSGSSSASSASTEACRSATPAIRADHLAGPVGAAAPGGGPVMKFRGPLVNSYWSAVLLVVSALVPFLALSSAAGPLLPIIGHDVHLSTQALSLTLGLSNAAYALGTVRLRAAGRPLSPAAAARHLRGDLHPRLGAQRDRLHARACSSPATSSRACSPA